MAGQKKIKPNPGLGDVGFLQRLGQLLNQVGLAGFIAIAITAFIFKYASEEQKERIIETWVLFQSESNLPCIFVVAGLVAILIVQSVHHKRLHKMNQQRIDELAKQRTELQSVLLRKQLRSSNRDAKR